jgi:TfoX/Sxy family transcriptional regulator of competence genes
MATDQKYIDFILDQIHHPAGITYKKMFGEYGLYAGARIFALVCDNQLLIKPTEAGKAFIGTPNLAPPFPGAKPYYLIQDELEDYAWISSLVKVTVNELPDPKPKKPKKIK